MEYFISWEKILVDFSSASRSSQSKCKVRLLDTVFIDNSSGRLLWYFTKNNGIISKKKDDLCTIEAIVDRFRRFAFANPTNVEKYIAIVVDKNGLRRRLVDDDFQSALKTLPKESFIQVFLRPKQGLNQLYVAEHKEEDRGNGLESTRLYFQSNDNKSTKTVIQHSSTSDQICAQMDVFVDEFVHCLRAQPSDVFQTDSCIKSLEAVFILDDNDQIWLSHISRLATTGHAEDNATVANLGSSAAHQDMRNSTDQSSSSFRPGSRTSVREVATSNVAPGDLIVREGRTILCTLGPDDLPGLRAWSVASVTASGDCVWAVDLAAYSQGMSDPGTAVLRADRAKTRFSVPQTAPFLRLLLLKGTEELLFGRVPVDGPADFAQRWRQLLQTALDAPLSARQSTDATVCGNCYAVLRKLESLIAVSFDVRGRIRPDSPITLPEQRPKSVQGRDRASRGSESEDLRTRHSAPESRNNSARRDETSSQTSPPGHSADPRESVGPSAGPRAAAGE